MYDRKLKVAALAGLVIAAAGAIGLRYDGAGGDMTKAADRLLASLSTEQASKARMAFEDPRRLDWHFIPKPERKGLQIKEMTGEQRKLAHALLHSGLSEVGYDKATTIMSLEAILHELEKDRQGSPIRDPERYYFTIFGTPAVQGKWGWSVEGHHLSLNFVINDGKLVSATPAFFGANPATIQSDLSVGPKKGQRTLTKEESLAFDLLQSLTPDQRKVAMIDAEAPKDIRGPAMPQAPTDPAQGVASTKMTESQQKTLWSLIEAYAGNMPQEVGAAWLAEIKKAGTDKIQFAWAGADKPGVGHYYRVQGPTFLIEFVNVQPDSANNPANHIHSVWRSLAGDFGVTL
jgi:Protein of unknown function (DUF3500)